MFTKEAIETLSEAEAIGAAEAALQNTDASNVVALPSTFELHDLEKHLLNRRRARGTMATDHLGSMGDYAKLHAEEGASVFVNAEKMSATAVLNLGSPSEPGHADNTAVFAPVKTAAYAALLAVADQGLRQGQVAEFFEDWPDHIEFFSDTTKLSPPKAIAAVRKITIENLKKLGSTEEQLSASRSTFESVSASSEEPIPTIIYFSTKPYDVLASRTFVLRLTINTGGNVPVIVLRIATLGKHKEEMALELADLVRNEFAGTLPVVLGTYTATR